MIRGSCNGGTLSTVLRGFVTGVLITEIHRQLPPDQVDRGHHARSSGSRPSARIASRSISSRPGLDASR